MPPITDIVDITISRNTRAAKRSSFGVVLVIGESHKLPMYDIVTLTLDIDLVAANVINGKVNGVPIAPVTYAVSHDATMTALAVVLQALAEITTSSAAGKVVTNTAATKDTLLAMTEFVVTGGVSQPVITIARTPYARTREYSTIAEVDVDFATTDPEYLAAAEFFNAARCPESLKIGRIDAGEDHDDALTEIVKQDDDWYGLLDTLRTQADVEDVVAWVETRKKLFFTASADPNILTVGVADIAGVTHAAARDRTAVFYQELAATMFPDAEVAAIFYSYAPGEATLKFKETANTAPSTAITLAERGFAIAKGANLYETYGDRDMWHEGTVASGEFADTIRNIDWLEATMTDLIFELLADAPKIPYTNAGIAQVEAQVRAALDLAVDAGVLRADPDSYDGKPYNVETLDVNDIDPVDRAARTLPDDAVTFDGKVAGAIHHVEVSGTVTA